jgi:hypothetical protein
MVVQQKKQGILNLLMKKNLAVAHGHRLFCEQPQEVKKALKPILNISPFSNV